MTAGVVGDLRVEVLRVGPIEVPLPRYQTRGAAGMDLHAAIDQVVTLPPLGRVRIPTGLAIAVPAGYEAQVRPRSGLAARSGLTILNAPGTVDSDYRGEIMVLLVNVSDVPATVAPLERIAQLVIAAVAHAELVPVEALDATERGSGGYGSTGAV